MFCVLFVSLIFFISDTVCDNVTDKYVSSANNHFQSRQSRLISFNTLDGGDISIELAFNVPFISIPVKKSLDMANGAIANVNIGAVVLAGAMVFGIAVFIPAILVFFTKKMYTHSSGSFSPNSYRSDAGDKSSVWNYLNSIDEVLIENNIDSTSCIQRVICWYVKNSSKNVSSGHGNSNDKIIDGLATNKWVQSIIYETAMYEALNDGLDGSVNCAKKYDLCKISQRSVQALMKRFVKTINK